MRDHEKHGAIHELHKTIHEQKHRKCVTHTKNHENADEIHEQTQATHETQRTIHEQTQAIHETHRNHLYGKYTFLKQSPVFFNCFEMYCLLILIA